MDQLSLFDIEGFLPDSTSFDIMTIEEAAETINTMCGIKLKPSKFVFEDDGARMWSCKHKGCVIQIYFTNFFPDVFDGRRFLSVDVMKGNGHAGYIALSIAEAVADIRRYIL